MPSITFKEWVISHHPDPEYDWNWDDPEELKFQLIENVKTYGNLNLKQLFSEFVHLQTENFGHKNLTFNQIHRFRTKDY